MRMETIRKKKLRTDHWIDDLRSCLYDGPIRDPDSRIAKVPWEEEYGNVWPAQPLRIKAGMWTDGIQKVVEVSFDIQVGRHFANDPSALDALGQTIDAFEQTLEELGLPDRRCVYRGVPGQTTFVLSLTQPISFWDGKKVVDMVFDRVQIPEAILIN